MRARNDPKISLASYRRIYSRVPRVCVDVLIRKSGGVLLSRRSIQPSLGSWHLPGGRVHRSETLAHAAKRICREELGVGVEVLKVLGVVEYLRERRAPGFVTHSVSTVLLVRPVAGTLRGSWQAREVRVFRVLPERTIPEARAFLLARRLVRR